MQRHMTYIFALKIVFTQIKLLFLKKDPIMMLSFNLLFIRFICSISVSSVIYLIIFFNVFTFFENTCRYFSSINVCSLITVRSYFGFPKCFIVDGFAIKFLFSTPRMCKIAISLRFKGIIN